MYVQALGEAFSPQKKTFSASKNEIYELYIFLWSFMPFWIRIRLANPDPGFGSKGPIESESGFTTLTETVPYISRY
jgi:hypothetical protein